ncbi:MAG TPA: LapA family protein, partial [Desulfomonilia bacterium]|nr:LapA family protein [Desulfomonilia bacterium]
SVPLQLWTLMVIFFVAGVVPIMVIEFPRQITRHLKMRAMKNQIRLMEDSLRRLAESPSDPAE